MNGIATLFVGWLLGLASPLIVDAVKEYFGERKVRSALKVELEDLKVRLAVLSFLLRQRYGQLDRQYLEWALVAFRDYAGGEPTEAIRATIDRLLALDERALLQLAERHRAPENTGVSLKTFRASFLESHLANVAKLPVAKQREIHEFRNQLDILNQEVSKAESYHRMTYDPSIGEQNHPRVVEELFKKYNFIEERCRIAIRKIETALTSL